MANRKKKKLTPLEEKNKGNDLFKLSHFADAVQCYSKAIDKAEKAAGISTSGGTGDGSEDGRWEARERSVYYLNRAQGWLKLDKYAEAEADCTVAISLTSLSPSSSSSATPAAGPSSKAYWRRAMARKELAGKAQREGEKSWRIRARGGIDDYRKWHALATADKTADANSVRVMKEEVEALEKKLKSDTATTGFTSSPAASPARPRPSTSGTASTSSSATSTTLSAIHQAHSELSTLWTEQKGRIITAWAELSIKELRVQKCKDAFAGLVPQTLQGQRDYPELRPDVLSTHSNLLDLISSRALRPPSVFAFHLDHVRASTVLKSRAPPPPPTSRYNYMAGPPPPRQPAEPPLSEYLQILETDGSPSYGEVVAFNRGNPTRLIEAQKKIEVGEACKLAEGELMLERQRILYTGALRAAKSLLELTEEDDEVDEDAVEEYEGRVKARDYAGREEYRIERVEETVKGFLGYAEDHLEFLRTDSEYVADYVLDRISPSVKPETPVQKLLVKEEALQLFLNGYARQTLWKEALTLLSQLRETYPSNLGTSPTFALPPAYARKVGLVAKLVDAFVDLAWRELQQSVEHSFEKEFRLMGQAEGNDEFYAFLDMLGEINGLAGRRPNVPRSGPQVDPLARMFRALTKIDPSRNPEKTWEIVESLNGLKALFRSKPEQKSRLSRRLVEGVGEYAEAIELREMLLDSHLPRFQKDWADKSTFLSQVHPLWLALERCWVKSVTNDMTGQFIKTRGDKELDALWSSFDGQAIKDCKALPGQLFDDLVANDPNRPANSFLQRNNHSDDYGGESDGPPPLVEISDDEASDDDGPPALVSGDGDEEDNDDSDSDDDEDDPYNDQFELMQREFEAALGAYSAGTRAAAPTPPPARSTPPPRPRPAERVLTAEERRKIRDEKAARRAAKVAAAAAAARPEPTAGPSSGVAPSRRPGADGGILPSPSAASKAEEEETAARRRGEKVKTRKGRAGGEDEGETTTTESETEDEAARRLPEDFRFKVSRRYYDVWEQMLGGENVRRSDVAWQDFMQAMEHVGFQADKGSGSRWKFHPRGELRTRGTMFQERFHAARMVNGALAAVGSEFHSYRFKVTVLDPIAELWLVETDVNDSNTPASLHSQDALLHALLNGSNPPPAVVKVSVPTLNF